jgi:hemoglobin/transferrin/lactoferrin receptor protein
MTFLTILLSAFLFQTTDSTVTNPDSIRLKEIKEVTVYSIASNKIGLPYVAIDKKELQKQDFRTPADALQTLTGVALSRDGSWATSVNVRGMGEQRLMLMVDGDRLQTATDVAGALSTVSLNQMEKIEVIKGAGSVLFGSGAMGGVVNFVSERPEYSDVLTVKGSVQTGFSAVNNLVASSAKVDFTNNKWYVSATGSSRNAGNTTTAKGKLPNSQFHDASWSVKGGMRYGDNQELVVGYNEFYAWDAGIPGNNAFPKTATVRYTGIQRRQLNGEYIFTDLSDLVTKLSIKGYTQNIGRNVENIFKPNATTTKIILPSSYNVTSGVKATADLYFNDYNTMTVGVESWLRKSETMRINLTYVTDTTVIGDQPSPLAKVWNAGAFALYKKVIDPKYLNINFGVRLDYLQTSNDTLFKELFKYTIKNGIKTDDASGRIARILPSSKPDYSYSAHIDFEYMPAKRNKLTLMLATAYRVATIEERFKYIDLGSGTPKIGNPDLKPEKGGFSNLSYIFSGKNLNVKADVFANYFFDLIAETTGTYTPVSGTPFSALISNNINKALFAGAEVELNWLINKQFSFYTNASYVRAQDMSNGKFLTQIPPMHGVAQLNYRLPKLFNAGISARWAATQTEAAETEVQTPGHVILNFDVQSANIKIKETALRLFAGVDNILDKAYKNHLFATRGFDYYEPGRNIYVKLNWGF